MQTGATPPTPVETILPSFGLHVMVSRRTLLDKEWVYDFSSPFWRLYVNKRAGAFISRNGKSQSLLAGRIYLIPAWVRFQTGILRAVLQDYIHFELAGFPPTLHQRVFRETLLLPEDRTLSSLCHKWQEGLTGPAPTEWSHWIWAHALANAAFATALPRMPEWKQELQWPLRSNEFQAALACIDRRLKDPPSNDELARLCNSSTDHFIRRFREAIGLTPARFGLERRISIAAQWLTSTRRSVDDIAESAGFTDRFHFSRIFKDRLGVPPASYRRMHRSEAG